MKFVKTLFLLSIIFTLGSCQKNNENVLKTRTLQLGSNLGVDTYVESCDRYQNENFGNQPEISAQIWTDNINNSPQDNARILINFPELNQMSGHEIDSVKLTLYKVDNYPYLSGGQFGLNANYVYCITEKWDQSTVTWNTQPSFDISQSVFIPTDNDYDSIVVDLTPLIPEEMEKGYGFMFIQQNRTPYSSSIFCSSNNNNSSKRPKLTIYYK